MIGRENLAAFYAAQAQGLVKIHIVGDSKAAANANLPQHITAAANGHPVQITTAAYSGQNSHTWANGAVQTFLSTVPNCDLLIVNFGTNEGVGGATGGAQDLCDTEANHLSAINLIRKSRPISALSILLMGQTPCNNDNPAYNQTTARMRGINEVLADVAKAKNCGFFDPLELFERAHSEAGWMDQLPPPTYGGGNVHPGPSMNAVLYGELGKALFPVPYSIPAGSDGIVLPPLQSGWVKHTVGYEPRAVLRNGHVQLNGVIKPGTVAAQTVLFTLPAGYRPTVNRFFNVSTGNGGTSCEVQVLAHGPVRIAAAFAGTYVSLDGISFVTI